MLDCKYYFFLHKEAQSVSTLFLFNLWGLAYDLSGCYVNDPFDPYIKRDAVEMGSPARVSKREGLL